MLTAERPMLTSDQVAKRLNMTDEAVRRYLRLGQLRGVRFGNRLGWRISEEDLDRFIAARRNDRSGMAEA